MNTPDVPYIVHEGIVARQERTIRRLWILCILTLILFVGSNILWICYEAQYQTSVVTQEVTQDSSNGSNTFVGGDYNGETESKDYSEN